MKTTIDIQDHLLAGAKRHAKKTGRPLRAVVEDGLRMVLDASRTPTRAYRLPDLSTGDPCGEDPLEAYSWQDLSEVVYGGAHDAAMSPARAWQQLRAWCLMRG